MASQKSECYCGRTGHLYFGSACIVRSFRAILFLIATESKMDQLLRI